MARVKKTMWLDTTLVSIAEAQADRLDRKLPYIIEMSLINSLSEELPADFRPGKDNDE